MQWMSDFSAAATFLMPSVKSDVRVHNTLLLPNQLRHSIKTLCLENFYRRSLGSSFTLFRHDNFSVTRVLCTRCVYTFLCVYVWSDLSCDLCVIEGSGAHMGSAVLIISPRDISGSSVLQCCRHASGPRTRGKVSPWTRSGHVAWTEISIWRGHPGRNKVHQVWCRHHPRWSRGFLLRWFFLVIETKQG